MVCLETRSREGFQKAFHSSYSTPCNYQKIPATRKSHCLSSSRKTRERSGLFLHGEAALSSDDPEDLRASCLFCLLLVVCLWSLKGHYREQTARAANAGGKGIR